MGGVGVGALLCLSGIGREVGCGGRLLTFSAFRMGAYSKWALIRSWALIRINTVVKIHNHKIKSNTRQAGQDYDTHYI